MVIFLVFFITFDNIGFAQNEPKPVLVDEFGRVSCEDFLARIDAFVSVLQANPQDSGYVVIYDGAKNPKGLKKFAVANVSLRPFDSERIKIVVAKNPAEVDARFWRVPPGSPPPTYTEVLQPETDTSKPFVFGTSFTDNVCPTFAPKLYADLIKQHPGSKGKVVVSGSTWRQRRDYAEEELKTLWENFGVSRDRIRIYYMHTRNDLNTEAEYWFVPAKKK